MKLYQKAICTLAALCLIGSALAGFASISAKANETLYDIEEVLMPVWEGNTSYCESVLPIENEYGGIDPISLLYPIEEIVSVQNAELTVTYQAGVDYAVSGGKLIIADDGNIPTLSHAEYHPSTGQAGFESTEGGYVCFYEGAWYHKKQIVVTYKHSAKYDGYVPEGKAELLQNVLKKLNGKENIDLLVFGDSISVGGNSSSLIGASPYLPIYPELFKQKLENAYGVKVSLTNPSVGGMGVEWGIEQTDGILEAQEGLDLAIVAFGMNDGGMTPTHFAQRTNMIVSKIKSKFPQADVLLIATMLPNKEAKNFYLNQENFADEMLKTCEKEGVAVVNMTAVHASLLKKKRYGDMTGNNVNHPNDYLARVYAQTLFATLQEKAAETPTDGARDENSDTNQGETDIFGTLLGGCNGTASVAACGVAAAVAATVLKKKKDE